MEKEKDRDLGFVNGIKAELLPLIAGLVSFGLLAEKVVNQMAIFFSVSEVSGVYIFILVYFIVPVALIFFWLLFFNHREGLKKYFLDERPTTRWLLLLILSVFLLMSATFIFIVSIRYLLLSVACVSLILIYCAILLGQLHGHRYYYEKEFRQAKYQFCFVGLLLITLWGANTYRLMFSPQSEFKRKVLDTRPASVRWKSRIPVFITRSANLREGYDHLSDSIREFQIKFSGLKLPDTSYCTALQNLNYHAESIDINYRRKAQLQPLPFTTPAFKSRSEEMIWRYDRVTKIQHDLLLDHKTDWTSWMQAVQFKGMLLFNLLILFLLAIWYHAYTQRLSRNSTDSYSEIDISRASIYIIFLLSIPFFKPIEVKDIDFSKPYISLGSPLTSENKQEKIVEPLPFRLEQEKILEEILDSVKHASLTLKNIQEFQQRRVKHEPSKTSQAYDEKPIP